MASAAGEVRLAPLQEAVQAFGGVLAAHDAGQQRGDGVTPGVRAAAETGARAGQRGLDTQRACRAMSSVARWTCAPAGTTSCTSPVRSASAAPNSSAVSRKRIALPQPSWAGARKVAPPNGTIPRPISSCRKRTSSAAITMSAARASLTDKVNAIPLTAMTTGLGTGSRHTPNGSKRCEPYRTLRAALGHRRADLGQVQARREVITMGEQHARAQLVIGAQDLVRAAQGVHGRQVDGVALGRAVNPDQQHVPVPLHGDRLGQHPSRAAGAAVNRTIRIMPPTMALGALINEGCICHLLLPGGHGCLTRGR
jgi:hypothetical protein